MKLIFICGSLEPGKDGVGDYTRRLAGELMRHGLKVSVIALNDWYSKIACVQEQVSESTSIPVFRIPSIYATHKQTSLAKQYIEDFNPDWLSFQFVPYSFHKKGVPFHLPYQLKKISGDRPWHIMFHELWLGLRSTDSIKYKIIGFIQRTIVKKIISKINVSVVHTHSKFYQFELKKLKLNPEYLPIFSNIPFNKNHKKGRDNAGGIVRMVVFGTLHPGAPVQAFAIEVYNYFKKEKDLKVLLTLVGRTGLEERKWVEAFKSLQIETEVLGELEEIEISNILQESTFGITTNPIFVVEKSGTIAAMREHHLPILIVSEETKPKEHLKLHFDADFIEYNQGGFKDFILKKHSNRNHLGLDKTCLTFLAALKIEV